MSSGGPGDPAGGLIEEILQAGEQPATPPGRGSELLTFLFADIRGYTSFTQQRGDEAAALLTGKFASIVRELVAEFDGTVFELRGDEAMCVFASPRQSLRLAVALQQRFVDETAADTSLPMSVGIGVDAGEAVRNEDGYRGGALNLAARLCSQAKAGEVLATAEVTHLARTIDGIRYVPSESVALKGLSEPVRPVRVLPDDADPTQQMARLLAAASTPAGSAAAAIPWLPGPLARLTRGALIAVVVVLVVVVAAVIVGVAHNSGGTSLAALTENSAGVINPSNGHLIDDVAVQAGPSAAATGFGSVWIANTDANSVSRINTSNDQVVTTFQVQTAPSAVAVGFNSVWVANGGSGTVSRIDPTTSTFQTIPVGTLPGGIAVADGSVWVTNTGDDTVSRIDPSAGKVVETVPVGDSPSGISAGRNIWVANSGSNSVSEIAGSGNKYAVVQNVPVGNDPEGITVVGDHVWVTNNLSGTVAQFPTNGTSVANTVQVEGEPTQIADVNGDIWVASQGGESVTEIDPATVRLLRTVPVGAIPAGLTAAGGRLWVTTTINPALHRGGTLNLAGQDPGPPDPDYVGTSSGLALLNGSYDGLVGFRRTTGAEGTVVVPDLATAIPSPTDNGRVYTFQLRSNIRWSNGQPLTVFDVRRGLERVLLSGRLTGLDVLNSQVVGASQCHPAHCDVRGIAVDAAARTVTITLVHANGDFLADLASGDDAVPAKTPLAVQTTSPIPATGPYQVARYVPGKLVVLTRNRFYRQWSAAAQPAGFPDQIDWRIFGGLTTSPEVKQVAEGRADWTDARTAGPLSAIEARFKNRVYVNPTEQTAALILNTRVEPFKDPRVRRALAFALSRTSVAADWFTPATVTCQVLPPDFPGHRPYCPYTAQPNSSGTWTAPEIVRAQNLVTASGKSTMPVTVWTLPNPAPAIRQVVTALHEIGFRHARIHVSANPNYFEFIADSTNRVQAFAETWTPNEPSASQFFSQLLRCSAFKPANPNNENTAEFCNHSIDRLMNRAERAQSTSPATANDLWAQVDRRIVNAAPWIPLVNPSYVDVVSARVHNYQLNPVLGVLFDQMWVR